MTQSRRCLWAESRLTRNILVNIHTSDDEPFNGDYSVSRDGTIKLQFLSPIAAQGRLTDQIEDTIAVRLIAAKFFSEHPRISARVADFATVTIGISGAVFAPRAVEIGGVSRDEKAIGHQGALPNDATSLQRCAQLVEANLTWISRQLRCAVTRNSIQ